MTPPPPQKASPEQLDAIGIRAAAMVRHGDRVGLGSGKAALAFVRALGQRARAEKISLITVATSLLTEQVARQSGLPIATLEQVAQLDITVNGADEIDLVLNLLKGGGGNLTREKVVASISQKFVIVAGEEKLVATLGQRFPVFVEVIEFARPVVIRKIMDLGATVEQRRNPDGSAFLTDNHNPYLHCNFPAQELSDPRNLDAKLHHIPGIVETGLFIAMAREILIARADGTIDHRHGGVSGQWSVVSGQ